MIDSSTMSEPNILLYNKIFSDRIIIMAYNKVKLRRPENIPLLMEVSLLEPKSLRVYVSSYIRSKINKYGNN
jgi:hypothetical protein